MTPISLGIFASANQSAAATSFESIATATGTGSSGTITFSSIPGTYQHLQIRAIGRTSSAGTDNDIYLQFNGITTTTYDRHFLRGNGTAASAGGAATVDKIAVGSFAGGGAAANIIGAMIIDIHDYASTTKNKTVRAITGEDQNSVDGNIYLYSGLWRNTSAVTSITLTIPSFNFTTASTFALYGIKGA